ncbi:MAG TPA: hypothetical protein VM264_08025 [Acidimicrobiales bacterium]|nr:hypothetical protein [Acidimicrobiales bacterium]
MAGAAAAVIMIGGLGACGDDDDDPAAATSTTAAPDDDQAGGTRNALKIVGNEYSFEAPASITGGLVDIEFDNKGSLVHEAFILGVGDTPQAEALAEFEKVVTSEEGVPIPDFLVAGGGATETAAGETTETTILLPAGKYLIVCALTDEDSREDEDGPSEEGGAAAGGEQAEEAQESPPHFNRGMVVPLTVTGGDPAATLPEADVQVTARDYSFDIEGLEAGDETVSFLNAGPAQIHHAVVFEFAKGVTPEQAEAAIKAFGGEGPPPPGTPEPTNDFGGTVFDPGRGGTFEGEFQSGRTYAFVCFINDRAGGPPHAFANDMFKAVAVP